MILLEHELHEPLAFPENKLIELDLLSLFDSELFEKILLLLLEQLLNSNALLINLDFP